MGIISKIIERIEKKYIKHLAQDLAQGKLSNNNVFVFVSYCYNLYINNIYSFNILMLMNYYKSVLFYYYSYYHLVQCLTQEGLHTW